jgi:hypothetical protein
LHLQLSWREFHHTSDSELAGHAWDIPSVHQTFTWHAQQVLKSEPNTKPLLQYQGQEFGPLNPTAVKNDLPE